MERAAPPSFRGPSITEREASRDRHRYFPTLDNLAGRWLFGALSASIVGSVGVVFKWWASNVLLLMFVASLGALLAVRLWQLIWSSLRLAESAIGSRRANAAASEDVRLNLAHLAKRDDLGTHEHSRWVAETAVLLGRELGLDDKALQNLYWAGVLHDLGKLAVPKAILGKTGRLTEEELKEIRRHPVVGADIVAAVLPNNQDLVSAIRHHHERWDGNGYPAGLRGTEIPLQARIISIVDVFEALTSDRAYRAALSPEQAVVYIRGASGLHFDSELVHSFAALYASGRIHRSQPDATTVTGVRRSGRAPAQQPGLVGSE